MHTSNRTETMNASLVWKMKPSFTFGENANHFNTIEKYEQL